MGAYQEIRERITLSIDTLPNSRYLVIYSAMQGLCLDNNEVNIPFQSSCLVARCLLYFDRVPPSSRGLGRRPFKPATGIRIPLGAT